MRRFYSVALARSLWGECGVVRHWGRIGTPGQRRTDWYDGVPDAERALGSLLRAKRRRGYRA
ncbi:WGR domain-containing protein [Rubellimicrobium roseum]|uniref:WGR domain-containing protein n=2 Tax=Rubellimicrobium roseum TaxID=687525 RepID=A0A5C4N6W5_9RHOB|nr:WGR domain-containing protein [Rubellimicrobium roseum]